MTNPPFTLMISVSLHLTYFSSSRVRLFFSLYFFCMVKVDLVREVSGSVCVLKKPGGRKNTHSVFEFFFPCHFEFQVQTKQSGRKGGSSLFQCQSWIQNQMRHRLHGACRINQIAFQTRRCWVGGSLIVRLVLVSYPCVQIGFA